MAPQRRVEQNVDDKLAGSGQGVAMDLRIHRARILYNRFAAEPAHTVTLNAAAQAAAIYEQLLDDGQRELVAEVGRMALARGKALELAASPHEACDSYQRAVALLSEAVTKQGVLEAAEDLATAMKHAATLLCSLDRLHEAAVVADSAVTLWSSLERADSDRGFDEFLADAHVTRAVCLLKLSALPAARTDLGRALDLFDRMTSATDTCRVRHAHALMELGGLERSSRQPERAVTDYEKALAVLDGIVDREADHVRALVNLNLGNALDELGNLGAALAAIERSIASWRQLVTNPREKRRLDDLGFALRAKGNYLMHQGLHAPALEAYLEAGAVFEQLVEIDRRHDLAIEYTKLLSATGLALENVGKLEPAYQMFHRVLENAGSISTEPGNREWLGFISFMKDHIRGVTRLLQMTPDEVPSLCDEVRQSLANAQQIGRAGEIRAALQIYERALTIASRIVELTRAPAHLALRANVLMHQGIASMHAGRTAASEAALRGAVVDLDRAVVLSPDHAQDWARARLGLAACLRMQHDEHGVRQVLQPVLDRRSSWLDRGWKEWRTKAESFLNEPGTP